MRSIYFLLLLIFIIYILIGFTARPMGDDWCEYLYARVLGPFNATVFWYETWSGRFTVFGAKSLLYATFGSLGPALLPVFMIVTLIGVWTYALRKVTPYALLLSAVITYGAIAGFPNIYHNFYYPSASLLYFAPLILLGLLVVAIVYRWHFVLLVVFAFLSGGVNEPQAGLTLLVLLAFWWRQRSPHLIMAMCALGIGLLVGLGAPGNDVRSGTMQPELSLWMLRTAAISVLGQLFRTVVDTPLALLIPFAGGLITAPRKPFPYAHFWIMLLALGVLFVSWLSVTPTIIALTWGPARIFTLTQVLFAVAAVGVGMIIGSKQVYSRHILAMLLVAALCLTTGWAIHNAPFLIAEARATDLGYITNEPTIRAGVIGNDADDVASCIRGEMPL
jgi:hypothetical protein